MFANRIMLCVYPFFRHRVNTYLSIIRWDIGSNLGGVQTLSNGRWVCITSYNISFGNSFILKKKKFPFL